MTTRSLPDYWPWMVAYHHVREPLYRAIINHLDLSRCTRVLDAGCGDAFYCRLFAEMLGPSAQVVGVDFNLPLLRHAGPMPANIQLCLGDIEHLGLEPASFDLVWLCRSMHSARDPLHRLAALVPLLRPGGCLVVVENDTAHYPILTMPSDFEHRLRDARLRYEQGRCDSAAACERYHAAPHLARWFYELGLAQPCVRTYVSEDLAPFEPEVEAYWRHFLAWDATHLEPYLAPADGALYCDAYNAYSPRYLLTQPGCYCLELTTVGCAIRPLG